MSRRDLVSRPRVHVVGLAGALGAEVLTAEALSERFDLTPERIAAKTGVTALRRLADGETLVGLGRDSVLRALDHAGIRCSDVAGFFGSSNPTSEHLLPTFTAEVAHAVGASRVIADHVGVGCCGGLQALRNACNQLTVDALSGRERAYVVVVGDQTSRMLDPTLRQTGTLFSEGAAAVVLTNAPGVTRGYAVAAVGTRSRLGSELFALRMDNPYAVGGPRVSHRALPALAMEGPMVFQFGVEAWDDFLDLVGLTALPDDGYVVPHQPNLRMLEALIARAGIDPARVYTDGIRTVGNTSGAAALLGLLDALGRGLTGARNPVLLGAFGAELQVGAALLQPVGDPRAIVGGA